MLKWDRRSEWLKRAGELEPLLKHWEVPARAVVEPEYDETAWQNYRMRRVMGGEQIPRLQFSAGEKFTVDFEETVTGRIRLRMHSAGGECDSPLRLRLYAAELPYEASNDLSGFHGELSRAWIQDEVMNFDVLPGDYQLPRRYSLRYLVLEIIAAPGPVVFDEITVIAEAAETHLPPPPVELEEEYAAIDRAAIRTLRNCMQHIMEDGPKRDRRLWLGDLYLQALTNSVSYKRFDLIERSLLLLAAATDDNGKIPACIFTIPTLKHGNDIIDYSLLLAVLLDDLIGSTGDIALGKSLYPLAVRQFELVQTGFDENGIYRDDVYGWHFIDWAEFNRQSSMHGVYIYGLRALSRLAKQLGYLDDSVRYTEEAGKSAEALRRHSYDPARHLVLSGTQREISFASQIWAIIAGVFSPEEAGRILRAVENEPGAVRPVTPFLYHHYLAALFYAGETDRAFELIRHYWGGMVRAGADTFWEVYKPDEEFLSPYKDVLLNSACHAWSCTPSYFLRLHSNHAGVFRK